MILSNRIVELIKIVRHQHFAVLTFRVLIPWYATMVSKCSVTIVLLASNANQDAASKTNAYIHNNATSPVKVIMNVFKLVPVVVKDTVLGMLYVKVISLLVIHATLILNVQVAIVMNDQSNYTAKIDLELIGVIINYYNPITVQKNKYIEL